MTATITERFEAAKQALDKIDQGHVLKFYDELNEAQQNNLLTEIEGVDWPEVAALVKSHVLAKPEFEVPDSIEPVPWYPYEETSAVRAKYIEAKRVGDQLIKDGKVAAFTVAGGQGSRLGWDAPKGTFPATPIRQLPLFACFAEYIHNIQKRFDVTIPWYVMTSPLNHGDTVTFFKKNNFFGLEEKDLMFFPQAMFPALDMTTGKVLMAAKDAIALSPNGHGGSLKALYTSGAIADMHQRGITQLSYTQVDNPNVRMLDPLFMGLHELDKAEMSSKMLPKAYPKEKMGVICIVDGKTSVIEYTNLPDELAEERDDAGELVYKCGNTATHAIRIDFIEKLNTRPTETGSGGFALPWNRAEKKVACIDIETAEPIEPETPNAIKLETFVFDALPLASASIVYETDRVDEFAPIKNADTPEGEEPAKDSAESSKHLQTERAARWLEANRVKVPRKEDGSVDAVIEIPQIVAIYPEDLKGKTLPSKIEPGSEVLI
jgi:UDP-N-acetylglucosamine/UDP-N-acetylgalactosamine diphosphorylase